jgi:hypothetical protein
MDSRPDATTAPQPAPDRRSLLGAPASRRETLLFGLLILALVWVALGNRPRTIVVVPDSHVQVGIIT